MLLSPGSRIDPTMFRAGFITMSLIDEDTPKAAGSLVASTGSINFMERQQQNGN
jgi:hypothetical protein